MVIYTHYLKNMKTGFLKMKFRDYQEEIFKEAVNILHQNKLVYLALEPRLGKTFISLSLAGHFIVNRRVLFITKKKAIGSIKNDYKEGEFNSFHLTVTNYEQAHKLEGTYDCIIIDEAHNYGTFPKPSLRYKNLLNKTKKAKYIIYLSATPTPESYSSIFHQFQLSPNSPFKEYKNFYKWCADYVDVQMKYFGAMPTKDYSKGKKDKILKEMDKYMVRYTQKQAGFNHEIKEVFIDIYMLKSTKKVVQKLTDNRVVIGKTGEIVADTGGKLAQKIHQLASGTVILEDGTGIIIDDTKANCIHQITGKKAVYYKFQAEKTMIIKALGKENITEDPEEFQSNDNLVFISQVQSGREGVKLDTADKLIMFNIDFAYLSYRQTMDRIQSYDRDTVPELVWLFSDLGIERQIYNVVKNQKESYTYSHYKENQLKKKNQGELIL